MKSVKDNREGIILKAIGTNRSKQYFISDNSVWSNDINRSRLFKNEKEVDSFFDNNSSLLYRAIEELDINSIESYKYNSRDSSIKFIRVVGIYGND